MTPSETVLLVRYVKACCPAAQIDEYTPDAWHDLLGDLELADCRAAAATVAKRQPFVAPSEIRAEVRRIREARLSRTPLPAPSAEAADEPGRYRQIVAANVKRIADGMSVQRAIGAGAPLPGDPPAEWQEARESLKPPEPDKPDPRETALEQVKAARAKREGRASGEPGGMSTPTPPDIALIVEWALDAHPTWEPDRLYGAVAAARTAQWPEAKIAAHLVRMAFDPAAGPWDLSAAAREPQGTAACIPAPREVIAQRMAEMRAALPQGRAS